MSNQEPQNQNKTAEEAGVEKRRRFIKGAGVATPVILTLSSPSVFGALCLSEIMSGNESHTGQGSCTLGENTFYWRKPANKALWPAGFEYGSALPPLNTDCSQYLLGTTFHSAFGVNPDIPGIPGLPVVSNLTTMLFVMCHHSTLLDAYLVAALLNARKLGAGYLLTETQVIGIKTGSPVFTLPPGYADVLTFLKSTMNTTPTG